jgi:hypothetical protein
LGDERVEEEMFAADLRAKAGVAVVGDFHSIPFFR